MNARAAVSGNARAFLAWFGPRGLASLLLALLVGGPALVFDGRGELQALRTFRRELDDEVVAALVAVVTEQTGATL